MEQVSEALTLQRIKSVRNSAELGHLHILQQLVTWYGEDRQEEIRQMIQSGDFNSFRMETQLS